MLFLFFFWKKAVKSPQCQGIRIQKSPLASSGWWLRLQTSALLLSLTDINLSKCVLAFYSKYFLLLRKINRSNKQQMYWFCLFRAFAPIFSVQTLQFFVGGGAKIVLSPVVDTLATPLIALWLLCSGISRLNLSREGENR